jgi:lipid II:glycine glycyltransferase (peptidoglycan interpeptide bridge formation enzyme)
LGDGEDNIWKKLDKGSVRWAIKKSQKSGINISISNDIDDIKKFYELNCRTKKDLGVPCHSWIYFNNMFRFLKDYLRLYIVKFDKEIIAGGIMEYYKNTVYYSYGAANPKFLKLYPYNAFIWKSIQDANRLGYRFYDFGRASHDNMGLIDFKKRWGTKEMKLYYSYYLTISNSLVNHRNNLRYKIFTNIIRNMPTGTYKKFSNIAFPHFG